MLKSNIEFLIKQSGLRKSFIAEKLGISVRQLRKYETGDALIPIDKAYILGNLICKKVDELYSFERENE
ncbi:helix-turn-helix domain-containing protein [Cytobacillus firmus]|uniref:helix-turn-helix domain-containing protein n=1 Tax=Cytobacillus firmus TaxID=1399 RepID=UPI00367D5921